MSHVDSLFGMLERALQSRGASDPLTVEEVYQRYLPYRTVRTELGIVEFAAYERALLELFAGRGGHLHLTEPRAREELERELASPNPILGLYRDYAHAGARLGAQPGGDPEAETLSGLDRAGAAEAPTAGSTGANESASTPETAAAAPAGGDQEPDRGVPPSSATGIENEPVMAPHPGVGNAGPETQPADPGAGRDGAASPASATPTPPPAPPADAGSLPDRGPAPAIPDTPPPAPSAGAGSADARIDPAADAAPAADPPTFPEPPAPPAPRRAPEAPHERLCIECEQPLPADPDLNFCPFCGRQQRPTECPECGLTLRPEWNFCIRCGTSIMD